uniref:Lipoyltransferase 1 n=1 Tax=Erpetoichthys calabaricus TaxID=27687 RepID=A0A8C4RIU5_ERPCA
STDSEAFSTCFRSAQCCTYVRSCSRTVFTLGPSRGAVLRSLSSDVYENLALEDWLHNNLDLSEEGHALLLWQNAPAVVMGRHQNPWQECNVGLLREKGVRLARRLSGGGTVYHDLGNLNITFFTSRKRYHRARNLQLVCSALKAVSPRLDVCVTDRFDLLLNGDFKVSGTAAKLGRTSAYHHCTLLSNTDRQALSAVLKSPYQGISSNATSSVPSTVMNLTDQDPALTCELLITAIAQKYAHQYCLEPGIALLDPTDEYTLPGIRSATQEMLSWEWVFGKTPKFDVSVSLNVADAIVTLCMNVKNGIIDSCSLELPANWPYWEAGAELQSLLTGSRFCAGDAKLLSSALLRSCPQTDGVQDRWRDLCEQLASLM